MLVVKDLQITTILKSLTNTNTTEAHPSTLTDLTSAQHTQPEGLQRAETVVSRNLSLRERRQVSQTEKYLLLNL